VVPSVTRRAQGEAGDLWVHVGVVEDVATSRWKFTVERPAGDGFEPIWSGESSSHPNFRLDLDGDGAMDPILPGDDGLQAWVGGTLVDVPIESTPDQFHGLPAAWGLETAVDLDGDGDRDVIADAMDGLHVVDVPLFRSAWKKASQGTISLVLSWAGRPVIGTHLDVLTQGRVSVLAPDAAHVALADFPRTGEFVELLAGVDPAGDGSLLPLHLARESALLAPTPGATPEPLGFDLAVSGDPLTPRARPGRFLGGSVDELVGVRILSMGSPAVGGTGETNYELVLVPAPGRGAGRVIRKTSIHGEGWIGAFVVDLENDGENEILLHESSAFAYCNIMDGGGSSSWWSLLRGDGTVLWQDEPRRYEFGPDYRHDAQAKAVLVDLFPDGAHGLRLRTADAEWWVLPAAHDVVPPVCLE
jgi:hypothetical protein